MARRSAFLLFDLGYFKLQAFARIAAAQAYFLSRLNHQTTLLEAVGGRVQTLELVRVLARESPPLLDKAIYLGARERVAARLIAARMPEAVVNEGDHSKPGAKSESEEVASAVDGDTFARRWPRI